MVSFRKFTTICIFQHNKLKEEMAAKDNRIEKLNKSLDEMQLKGEEYQK